MSIHKIAWLTDIHLNFLKNEARIKFYQSITKTDADAILITGDIAEANDMCEICTSIVNIQVSTSNEQLAELKK